MGISGGPNKGMQPFDQVIADLIGTYSIPGLALTVSRKGNRIIERGYGLLDTGDPASQVTAQNSFRIASLSKPITAMALLKLMTQGVLTLDTHSVHVVVSIGQPAGRCARLRKLQLLPARARH